MAYAQYDTAKYMEGIIKFSDKMFSMGDMHSANLQYSKVADYYEAAVDDSVDSGDCMFFWYDRNADGLSTNDDVGAFRRTEIGGVGVLERFGLPESLRR